MRKITFLVLIIVFGLISCSGSNNENLANTLKYSADELAPFISDSRIVKSNLARTGKFVFMVNDQIEYGLTFNSKLANLSTKPISKFKINTWIFPKSTSNASLVFEMNNSGRQVLYKNIKLIDEVKTLNKWAEFKMEIAFDKPVLQQANNEVKIYLWNPDKKEILMDDLTINFE